MIVKTGGVILRACLRRVIDLYKTETAKLNHFIMWSRIVEMIKANDPRTIAKIKVSVLEECFKDTPKMVNNCFLCEEYAIYTGDIRGMDCSKCILLQKNYSCSDYRSWYQKLIYYTTGGSDESINLAKKIRDCVL